MSKGILEGGELAWRGGVRLSDASGSMAAVYDLDLTAAIEELPPEFQAGLKTVLLHLVHVSVAKKWMTLVRLHGPVYPADKMSAGVASQD
jgi:hypothetical protein